MYYQIRLEGTELKYIMLYAKDSPAIRDFKRRYAFINGLNVCWKRIDRENVFEFHALCPDCMSYLLGTYQDVFGVVWQYCVNCNRILGIIEKKEDEIKC